MTFIRFIQLFSVGSLVSLSVLNCGGKSEGAEGGACYANATCDTGLICRSDLCVDPDETSAGGDEFSLNACLACGEGQCADQSAACDGADGCSKVLNCWLECVGDLDCQNACDVQGVTQADLKLVSDYFVCISQECLDDCVPDVSTGTGGTGSGGGSGGTGSGTGGGSSGEACVPGDASLGSCVDGTYQSCNGLEYESGDCTPCSIVSTSTSCVRGEAFVLRQESDTVVVPVPESKPTVVAVDGVSVTAQYSLDYSEFGVLQYVFTTAVNPTAFRFTSDTSNLQITVETASGGCTYSHNTSTNGIEREITIDWNGCWGTFASLGASEHPSGATIVNFRTRIGGGSTISISGIVL